MGVAVLNPQDCLKQPFSHINRQKKPTPNRTRRSPPRNQSTKSPPPPVAPPLPPPRAAVRILKRGESIPQKTSDPITIPHQVRKSKTAPFYAGPVTMSSPPPSDVPLPAFFVTKKNVPLFQAADATNDLIRILRLDIA